MVWFFLLHMLLAVQNTTDIVEHFWSLYLKGRESCGSIYLSLKHSFLFTVSDLSAEHILPETSAHCTWIGAALWKKVTKHARHVWQHSRSFAVQENKYFLQVCLFSFMFHFDVGDVQSFVPHLNKSVIWFGKINKQVWKNWYLAGSIYFLEAKMVLKTETVNNINVSLWEDEKWGVKRRNNKEKRKRQHGRMFKGPESCPPHSNRCHVSDGEQGHAPVSSSVSFIFFVIRTSQRKTSIWRE